MPDWALEIFSENIIGAGSIRTGEETDVGWRHEEPSEKPSSAGTEICSV